jgi:predicted aminopeptidase
MMTVAELVVSLERGPVVAMSVADWQALAPSFEALEDADTFVSGRISIARGPAGVVVVVEEPRRDERVLRRMVDLEAARALVAERLATYERMWNGCGCKVDYYR